MKRIRIISMVSAILIFVLAFVLFSGITNRQKEKAEAEKPKVIAAVSDIKPYTKITEEMVIIQNADTKDLAPYFTEVKDVVGKVTISDIYAGEALTKKRLLEANDPNLGLSSKVKNGMRAITVPVDAMKGVGFNLKVGYKVDVLMTREVDGAEGGSAKMFFDAIIGMESPKNTVTLHEYMGATMATLTLQNLKIIAIDNSYNFTSTFTEGYSTVTLEVTPKQAEQIALINGNDGCNILFTLRTQEDEAVVDEPRGVVIE